MIFSNSALSFKVTGLSGAVNKKTGKIVPLCLCDKVTSPDLARFWSQGWKQTL
jgi:hypothetical protein